MGDMNAKVGADNELYNMAVGEHGSEIINENRSALHSFFLPPTTTSM